MLLIVLIARYLLLFNIVIIPHRYIAGSLYCRSLYRLLKFHLRKEHGKLESLYNIGLNIYAYNIIKGVRETQKIGKNV